MRDCWNPFWELRFFRQKFSTKTSLFHICDCVVMLPSTRFCSPVAVLMATSSDSSICIVEGSKERHHHPQKVWRPFSISVSVIGRILYPNVAMSHSCWSWFCIQFSFIPFPWIAVSDYLNLVHINSHNINLLNINLRAINFEGFFCFFHVWFFFSPQKLIYLSAMKWTALGRRAAINLISEAYHCLARQM